MWDIICFYFCQQKLFLKKSLGSKVFSCHGDTKVKESSNQCQGKFKANLRQGRGQGQGQIEGQGQSQSQSQRQGQENTRHNWNQPISLSLLHHCSFPTNIAHKHNNAYHI